MVAAVDRARHGAPDGWNDLVSRYSPVLWAVARSHRLSRQDAADAVQVTWLRCVEQLDRIREPERLAGWLVTVCRRECLLILRTGTRCRPYDGTDPLGPFATVRPDTDSPDPADVAIARAEAAAVREAIRRSPGHSYR